jgi:hypothetical protein
VVRRMNVEHRFGRLRCDIGGVRHFVVALLSVIPEGDLLLFFLPEVWR